MIQLVSLVILLGLSSVCLAKVVRSPEQHADIAPENGRSDDVLRLESFLLNITSREFPDVGPVVSGNRGQIVSSYFLGPQDKMTKSFKTKGRRPTPSRDLNVKQRKQIVSLHNNFRRRVPGPASNMEEMQWDNSLAKMAKIYSKECVWQHGNPKVVTSFHNIGQNLAWSSSAARQSSATFMLSLWNNERKYYNILTNKCQDGRICGHYTQMVWANTKFVGCAINMCPRLFDPSTDSTYNNAHYLVCNYGEGGNVVGIKPYNLGQPCSDCESGKGACRNGLCSDCIINGKDCVCALECSNSGVLNDKDCTCDCAPGFTGPSCQSVCNNTHRWCGNGWPKEWCFKYDDANPVETLCPALCGLCQCGGPPCQNGGIKNPDTCMCECAESWSGPACTDCNVNCQHGQLDTNKCTCECEDGWTGDTCSDRCQNNHEWCWNGWYPNWCDEDHAYVPEYCPAMCGLCRVPEKQYDTPDSPCEDKFFHCKWSLSTCNTNPDFATNYCPLSCGLCTL